MATARRCGNGTVVLDGRILDLPSMEPLTLAPSAPAPSARPLRQESKKAAPGGMLQARALPKDTPPSRISGVSMAPLPELHTDSDFNSSSGSVMQDHHHTPTKQHPGQPGSHDASPSGAHPPRSLKKPWLKVAVPHHQGHHQGLQGDGGGAGGGGGGHGTQLVAQGRAVQRQLLHHSSMPTCNRQLSLFREINEADSLCGTPPSLSVEAIAHEFRSDRPMGPLTPTPLSPSVLTLCGLSSFDYEPPNERSSLHSSCSIRSAALPDMHVCRSPEVPSS